MDLFEVATQENWNSLGRVFSWFLSSRLNIIPWPDLKGLPNRVIIYAFRPWLPTSGSPKIIKNLDWEPRHGFFTCPQVPKSSSQSKAQKCIAFLHHRSLAPGGGGPPLSWGFFPYAAISVLQALQHMGLAKRAQLKVSVVEIYLDPRPRASQISQLVRFLNFYHQQTWQCHAAINIPWRIRMYGRLMLTFANKTGVYWW